jgi:hypothetical protein
MIDPQHTWTSDDTDDTEDAHEARHPSGHMRLAPVITFGMRAAALAGVAVAVGMTVAGVAHGSPADTTCCT